MDYENSPDELKKCLACGEQYRAIREGPSILIQIACDLVSMRKINQV